MTTRSGGAPDGFLDVRCDVTDPEAVEAAFAEIEAAHGPVEVLVANAGITADTLLAADDGGRLVLGDRHQPHRLLPGRQAGRLQEDARLRRGRIVFISSVVGLLGSAGQVNYAASKAGLVGMARSIARELGSAGRITANVVAPGFVETDMTADLPDDKKAEHQDAGPARPLRHARRGRGRGAWLASRRGGVHHRRRHPGRRRPRHGPLTPTPLKGHIHGHSRRQTDPGRRRHDGLVDRLRDRQGGAGAGRDGADLELRPGAEHHQADRQAAADRTTRARARRHRRVPPRPVARPGARARRRARRRRARHRLRQPGDHPRREVPRPVPGRTWRRRCRCRRTPSSRWPRPACR